MLGTTGLWQSRNLQGTLRSPHKGGGAAAWRRGQPRPISRLFLVSSMSRLPPVTLGKVHTGGQWPPAKWEFFQQPGLSPGVLGETVVEGWGLCFRERPGMGPSSDLAPHSPGAPETQHVKLLDTAVSAVLGTLLVATARLNLDRVLGGAPGVPEGLSTIGKATKKQGAPEPGWVLGPCPQVRRQFGMPLFGGERESVFHDVGMSSSLCWY